MRFVMDAFAWIGNPAHWSGADGILTRIVQHLGYSALALVIAGLIAIPVGLYIGHTGRFRVLAVALLAGARALPSLGLLTLLAVFLGFGLSGIIVPATIALVVLAIPPILASTYSGVEAIAPGIVDAARGCGHSEMQIVGTVEVPLAGPMILGGIRSAAVQLLASATIAAYPGLGGLGRYILDGLPVRDYPKMLAGALLVIALALLTDAAFGLAQRALTRRVRSATT
ncbi:MAG: ABC transporter permease subunit [Propionibacteriaceae bacterium]|nr:ABC transporter permease subunit [Propionibacteriaceae bacterium]